VFFQMYTTVSSEAAGLRRMVYGPPSVP